MAVNAFWKVDNPLPEEKWNRKRLPLFLFILFSFFIFSFSCTADRGVMFEFDVHALHMFCFVVFGEIALRRGSYRPFSGDGE